MRELLMEYGEWGVGFLMLLQNLIPVLPSEVIMPLAGFLATIGYMDMSAVVVAGLLGSLLGHLPWYFLGFALGEERLEAFVAKHGHWIHLRQIHIRKAGDWFERNSVKAVLLGRLVPGLRTCVNIPAGTSRMSFMPFILYTIVGDAIWITLLATGGYLLGRDYLVIMGVMHIVIIAVAGALGAMFIFFWIRRHAQSRRPA
ncbi:MAG: DedA family protein [Fibrobacterota bacterium]|nr:DedA family protein [Fibrobacterota bacterium]